MSILDKIRKGQVGAKSKFDLSFKRKVVLEHHHGTGPLIATASKYGIDRTTLVTWIKWYEKDQASLVPLDAMDTNKDDAAPDPQPVPDDLKALQEELRLARVKLACLESLIDITERDLGIDIRKKAGTRSSEA